MRTGFLLFLGGTLAVPAYCQPSAGVPKTPKPISPVVVSETPKQLAPAPPPSAEQTPPRAPQITWDGNQLSIQCENSTLADILRGVSERLKVPIEIPAGAAAERVATDLGPGPAREILTELLSGSRLNYIIQASDSQENAIKSVILSLSGNAEGMTVASVVAPAGTVRRMPGHEDSRQYTPEAHAGENSENNTEQQAASAEVNSTTSTSERAAVAPDAERSQEGPAPTPSNQDNLPSDGATAAQSSAPAQPSAPVAGNATSGTTNTSQDGNPITQQVEDLRALYEERRRMTSQQKATNAPPANPQNP